MHVEFDIAFQYVGVLQCTYVPRICCPIWFCRLVIVPSIAFYYLPIKSLTAVSATWGTNYPPTTGMITVIHLLCYLCFRPRFQTLLNVVSMCMQLIMIYYFVFCFAPHTINMALYDMEPVPFLYPLECQVVHPHSPCVVIQAVCCYCILPFSIMYICLLTP